MNTLFRYFAFCFLCLFVCQASIAQEKAPEPPKVPRPCYESLLKLDPVKYDTTETKIPYQTFLFRYQREYMLVVADTANFYSFNYKRVRQNGVKVDSLTTNSLAFDLSICKLFDVKELTLKEKKRVIGDLHAPHFYTFSKKQQRLYASMRAVETGKARTFVGKSLAELKQIPQIFSFIKAKPNEKLQAQMQAMKDQAKKMKDEVKKAKDQVGKVQETLTKLQEEKKKIEDEMAKLKKEKEDADKKEAIAVAKDSTAKTDKNNPTVKNDKNPKDNNPKDKNKNNNTTNIQPKDKNKAGKDSLVNIAQSTKKFTKQDSIVFEMNRVLKELEVMGNIEELNAKRQQLIDQKNEFENPQKKNDTEVKKVDSEKRKTEMMAKIHEINDLLRELADEKSPEIVSKRLVMKNRRDYLLQEIKKMDTKSQ